MADTNSPRAGWQRISAELLAYRTAQEQIWGGLDDITVARYLAGTTTLQESQTVEGLAATKPEVRELLALVRDVLEDQEPENALTVDGLAKPRTVISVKAPLRPRRRLAAIAALAASLLVGFGGGLIVSQNRDQKSFEVLTARADARSVGARGPADGGRAIFVESTRRGFASMVALLPDDEPLVFPRSASGPMPVIPGEVAESPPLPPGFDSARVMLVIITEQPAAETIRRSLDGLTFAPERIGELQTLLKQALADANYHWVAFTTVEWTPGQEVQP